MTSFSLAAGLGPVSITLTFKERDTGFASVIFPSFQPRLLRANMGPLV